MSCYFKDPKGHVPRSSADAPHTDSSYRFVRLGHAYDDDLVGMFFCMSCLYVSFLRVTLLFMIHVTDFLEFDDLTVFPCLLIQFFLIYVKHN